MKTKILVIILFLSLMVWFAFKPIGNVVSPKIFIGYINNLPVFDDYKEKKLYVFKDKLEFLTQYPNSYSPRIVKNEFICYEEKAKTGNKIVISSSGMEKKYKIGSNLSYVAIDNKGGIYYTDLKSGFSIKHIIKDSVLDLNIKGYVITIVDECLYYSKQNSVSAGFANSDIYELDFRNPKIQNKILANISGESTVIWPNKKYIYEQILIDGKFKPIIYSVEKKKYKELAIENSFLNAAPFYSYQKKTLVFYNIKTFEMKEIEVPIQF